MTKLECAHHREERNREWQKYMVAIAKLEGAMRVQTKVTWAIFGVLVVSLLNTLFGG